MKKLSYVLAVGGVMMAQATDVQSATNNNNQNASGNNNQAVGYNSQNDSASTAAQASTASGNQNATTNTNQNRFSNTGNTTQNNAQATAGNATQTASGLRYIDTQAGTGSAPRTGQRVTVHYTGTLENGTKFDSSRDRGQPFTFTIGTGQVIRGWDEGVSTMKEGGKRRLIIPSNLGYGPKGAGNSIPPNSTLIFDVELLKVE